MNGSLQSLFVRGPYPTYIPPGMQRFAVGQVMAKEVCHWECNAKCCDERSCIWCDCHEVCQSVPDQCPGCPAPRSYWQ
jgi:hypothetical protein